MEEEANFFEYIQVLWKRKRPILGTVFGITLTAILLSYFMTPLYKAEAALMPIGRSAKSGMSTAIDAMGLSGVMSNFGSTTDLSDRLVAILSSRTFAESIIKKFNLLEVFYGEKAREATPPPFEKVIEQFRRHVLFQMNRTKKLIEITSVMESPQLAAKIVNGCIEELERFLKEKTLTSAKKNRIFIEKQLERNRKELLEAGRKLLALYDSEKISSAASTVNIDVSLDEMSDGEKKHFTQKESPHQEGVTVGNESVSKGVPGVSTTFAQVQEKVDELKVKVDELKVKSKEARLVKDVPHQVYLQFLLMEKQLLGTTNAFLARQYEMSKINEADNDLTFEVIDYARIPVGRYRPSRKFIAITAFAASLLGSIFFAFLLEYYQKKKSRKSSV